VAGNLFKNGNSMQNKIIISQNLKAPSASFSRLWRSAHFGAAARSICSNGDDHPCRGGPRKLQLLSWAINAVRMRTCTSRTTSGNPWPRDGSLDLERLLGGTGSAITSTGGHL